MRVPLVVETIDPKVTNIQVQDLAHNQEYHFKNKELLEHSRHLQVLVKELADWLNWEFNKLCINILIQYKDTREVLSEPLGNINHILAYKSQTS